MIRLEQASLQGMFADASLAMGEGEICAILVSSHEDARLIVKLLTGIVHPSSGTIRIFGDNMAGLSKDALNQSRKRIGVAMKAGGLVSNLKVWENILLPLSYHGLLSAEEAEGRLIGLMEKTGYDDDLTKHPGSLPIHLKKLAGLMRAMLMDPDAMIYELLFDGLNPDIKNRVVKTVLEFHQEKTGRLSVFIERDENMPKNIRLDRVFTLERGRLDERD